MISDTYVIEIIQSTSDVKSIRFEKPQGFIYLAGQYIYITIGEEPNLMAKHFTLSSSLSEDFLKITRELTGHPSANALASLKSGDWSP
jgi:ferredoxin-NADP reductase